MNTNSLFNFALDADISNWRIVNDGVMGGRSKSSFELNKAGHGTFSGEVSLENYGGFASVRLDMETIGVKDFSQFEIRLKGDGKNYQFRAKASLAKKHSYIATIETTGEWQTVTLDFATMYPAFRGRNLDIPNYEGQVLAEVAFLIGNKVAEDFTLEIDYIKLK